VLIAHLRLVTKTVSPLVYDQKAPWSVERGQYKFPCTHVIATAVEQNDGMAFAATV
jgi:hypothetical protein